MTVFYLVMNIIAVNSEFDTVIDDEASEHTDCPMRSDHEEDSDLQDETPEPEADARKGKFGCPPCNMYFR